MQKGLISPLILLFIILFIFAFFLGTKYSQVGNTPVSQTIETLPLVVKISTIKTPQSNDWVTYKVEKLGMEFKLPPNLAKKYGKLVETEVKGQRGTKLTATFALDPKSLILGTESPEYEFLGYGGDGEIIPLTFLGFKYNDSEGKYYGLMPYAASTELLTKEITHFHNNGRDIIETTKLFDPPARDGIPYDNPPKIWGIINGANKPYYPGFTVQGVLSDDLTEDTFEQILSTFHQTQ